MNIHEAIAQADANRKAHLNTPMHGHWAGRALALRQVRDGQITLTANKEKP